MKNNIKKILKFAFSRENEFTKKWIARFTIVVFFLLLFYAFLCLLLLFLHISKGLSYQMCNMLFDDYTKFSIVLITGYSVTFLGQMGKAYMGKLSEEKMRLQRDLGINVTDDVVEESDEEVGE